MCQIIPRIRGFRTRRDRFVCLRGVVKSKKQTLTTQHLATFLLTSNQYFMSFYTFMTPVAVASQLFVLESVILFKLANELHLQAPYTVSFLLNRNPQASLVPGRSANSFDDRRRWTTFDTSKRRFLQAYLSILVWENILSHGDKADTSHSHV